MDNYGASIIGLYLKTLTMLETYGILLICSVIWYKNERWHLIVNLGTICY